MGCGDLSAASDYDKNRIETINPKFNEINVKYPDFEEIPTGPYLGLKVKKILNYQCPLTYDELENVRNKFWASRDKDDATWDILKICFELTGEEAEKLLEIIEQKVCDKDMRKTFSLRHPQDIYCIPNYCIAEPIFVRDYSPYEKVYDNTDDDVLDLNLFYFNDKQTYPIRIKNKCSGFDLKTKFSKMLKIDLKLNRVRLFCKGQEILDTHCLYFHQLCEDSRIIVSACEIVNRYINLNKKKS